MFNECNNARHIESLKNEIRDLKYKLIVKQKQLSLELKKCHQPNKYVDSPELSTEEVSRYSRQMLVPQIGFKNQIKLKKSKILVIGVGGLGCPSLLFLTAAGIGEITIIDFDDVETTNLHRQILHSEETVGIPKVDSAYSFLQRLNSNVKIIPIKLQANSFSLQEVFNKTHFDVVIDGSDNVATRYLLNDICVLNKVPLVSGSALQMEGQLTVYNHNNGPCYRCLFPVPPPVHAVTNCGDGGVLGVIPGAIGVLQALEAIKIITSVGEVLSGRLIVFDGLNSTFRNVKLRLRKQNCQICGDNPTIKELIDYEQFCGSRSHDKIIDIDVLSNSQHVDIRKFQEVCSQNKIIDVRPTVEYEMCKLPSTINFPFTTFGSNKSLKTIKHILNELKPDEHVYTLCRRGNDSQRAVHCLQKAFPEFQDKFRNFRGGLHAYSKYVDSDFPVY